MSLTGKNLQEEIFCKTFFDESVFSEDFASNVLFSWMFLQGMLFCQLGRVGNLLRKIGSSSKQTSKGTTLKYPELCNHTETSES